MEEGNELGELDDLKKDEVILRAKALKCAKRISVYNPPEDLLEIPRKGAMKMFSGKRVELKEGTSSSTYKENKKILQEEFKRYERAYELHIMKLLKDLKIFSLGDRFERRVLLQMMSTLCYSATIFYQWYIINFFSLKTT